MRAQLGESIPRETVATCDACVMLPPEGGAPTKGSTTYFNAATKCCTYLPELHNFLVGQIIADTETHPSGMASVERRIAAGNEVTPLGLGRSRAFLLLYQDGGDLVFGRSQGLLCPHYLDEHGGRCGIWQHRESTCSTWFCKHVRGKTGDAMWRAVQRLLRLVEQDLAWWCVRELDLDPASVSELLTHRLRRTPARVTSADIDRTPDVSQTALWGRWAGREREFFLAAGKLVAGLAWDEVLRIGGPDVALAADVVSALAIGARATELPGRLVFNPVSVTSLQDGTCTLTAYNTYDPLTLPLALFEVLDAFDGRPTAEVLQHLAAERDVELEPALVQRLIDFGVLASKDVR